MHLKVIVTWSISLPYSIPCSLWSPLSPLPNQTPVQMTCWLVFGNEFQMKSWLRTQTDCVCWMQVSKSVFAVWFLHAGVHLQLFLKVMVICVHTKRGINKLDPCIIMDCKDFDLPCLLDLKCISMFIVEIVCGLFSIVSNMFSLFI